MLTLVTGGSASGKSEYAERLLDGVKGAKYYIATMQPFDSECEKRIAKHRAARAGRGFETVERYLSLDLLRLPQSGGVLLECMSNLAANELYSEGGAGKNAVARILDGVRALHGTTQRFVIVSNEIFSDGLEYTPETVEYIGMLGQINQQIAQMADQVVEVVYTIPVYHKRVD